MMKHFLMAAALLLNLPLCGQVAAGPLPQQAGARAESSDRFRKLPKPVFSSDIEILSGNTFVRDIRNLTAHYFFGKSGGKYDLSHINPGVFRKNFVQAGIWRERDRNHPQLPRFMTLDIEYGIANPRNIRSPDWSRQIATMRLIARMMRAQGKAVAFYMNWHFDFQNPYNIHRQLFERGDLKRAMPFMVKQDRFFQDARVVAAEFRDMVDVVTYKGYAPYRFEDVDGPEIRRYLAALHHNARMMRRLYPGKPRLIWLQPNFTADKFSPMPRDCWERVLDFCASHDDIDGIIVFRLPTFRGEFVQQAPGWREWFRAAP
jgi:hypothetical protein